jgi:peptide/nickel transport system permease protein
MSADTSTLSELDRPAPNRLQRTARSITRFIRLQPLGAFGAVALLVIFIGAIFAPYLNTTDPEAFSRDMFKPPSSEYWFGTSRGGQDMWSRVLYGARPSLMIGFGAVGISIVVATSLALIAGFLRGLFEGLLLAVSQILIAVPGLLWLMLFTAATGRSVPILMFAIAFTFTPLIFIVLRGNVLQEQANVYVEASRSIGASDIRIMFRHILPNLMPLVIVQASIIIPAAILAEAGLTFLGLGLDPGTPSWAVDLGPAARRYFQSGWWLPVFPGLFLALSVLALNFLGDSLRDVLDPRLRGSGLV